MSTETATPAAPLEFQVEAEQCIGCGACSASYPALFAMNGDKAVVRAQAAPDSVRPRAVLLCCPVDAITLAGGAGFPAAETITSLPVVEGWEAQWKAQKEEPEELAERERRYGRVLRLTPLPDGWRLHVELPRGLPHHPLFSMHGIPREPPEYGCSVERLGPRSLSILAWLQDPKLRFLAGKTNSFPVSFRADYYFPAAIGTSYRRLGSGGIDVYTFKEGVADPRAALRRAMESRAEG